MRKEDYNNKIIEEAVSVLKDDGIILVPTDTVYGLAVSSGSVRAQEKIYEIKKRNLDKKLPLVVDTYERLLDICEIDKVTLKRLQRYFPGPVTLVLKRKGSEDTIAIRMINNEIINRIIAKLDKPLMLTSANISGDKISNDIMQIIDEFDGKIDMVIIGSKVGKVSSTIVKIIDNKIELIREGVVSFKEIEKVFVGD